MQNRVRWNEALSSSVIQYRKNEHGVRPGEWRRGYRLSIVLVNLFGEELQLVDVFHASFDEGLRLLIISLLATVERHPEGSDEPWVTSVVRVARVSSYSFGSIRECVLDLSRTTEDSRIVRFKNSERICEAEDCSVYGRVMGFHGFQESAALLVPQVFNDCSLQILGLVRPCVG